MLDYTICEKLKDEGFEQEPFWGNYGEMVCYGGSWYFIPVEEGCPQIVFADEDAYKKGIERGDNLIKMPSLSELVKTCGKTICGITQVGENVWGGEKTWGAWGIIKHSGGIFSTELTIWGYGRKPIIAVANLWLELDKTSKISTDK